MQSILDPTTCGYAKVKAYNPFKQDMKSKNNNAMKLQEFISYFNNQQLEMNKFKRFNKIKDSMFKLGKANKDRKKEVLDFFSEKKWNDLTDEEKQQHRIFQCPACKSDFLHRTKLSMFNLSKFDTYLSEANSNGLLDQKITRTNKDLN